MDLAILSVFGISVSAPAVALTFWLFWCAWDDVLKADGDSADQEEEV